MKKKKFILIVFILINLLIPIVSGNSSDNYSESFLSETITEPQMEFSTYYGGGNEDLGTAIFFDSHENIYVAGNTQSLNIPLKDPMIGEKIKSIDIFVAKFSSEGKLIKSTYFGGDGDDKAEAMWIDNSGRVYVAGSTTSIDFPVTEDAFQKENSGIWDAYIICFSEDLENVIYCTYIGGDLSDTAHDIVVGDDCCAYITGITSSENFPVTKGAFQEINRGRREAYVVKLNPQGSRILSSTYFGGICDDYGEGIALDKSENVYLTGYTYSSKTRSLPVKNPLFEPSPYSYDAYCASFDMNLSDTFFSTYIGGGSGDRGTDIFVSDEGGIYLTGYTYSKDFPVKNSYQDIFSGGKNSDAYIMSLSKDGQDILFSTFLGGENDDFSYEIQKDLNKRIIISGGTSSVTFPVTYELLPDDCSVYDTGTDSFVSIFGENGTLISSVRFGGQLYDYAHSFSTDNFGNIVIVGKTESNDFPVKNAEYNNYFGGNFDMFLTKLSISDTKNDNISSQMSGNNLIISLIFVLTFLQIFRRKLI